MAQEDDPQQGNQPGSDNTHASATPKHAAHMGDSSSRAYIIGNSSDPDSTSVYVQAAAQSRKRAAHMDRQKGIELEVENMMDEITGTIPRQGAPAQNNGEAAQQEHKARTTRRVRFAHHDAQASQPTQLSATSKNAMRTQQFAASNAVAAGGNAQGAPAATSVESQATAPDQPGGRGDSASGRGFTATNVSAASDGLGRSKGSKAAEGPAEANETANAGAAGVPPLPEVIPNVAGGTQGEDDSRGSSQPSANVATAHAAAEGYSPDTATNPYDDGKKHRRGKRKHHVVAIVVCVVLAVLAGVVAFGLWYLHDINSRLQDNLDTSSLSSELTQTPAGDPFYMLLLGTDKDEDRASGSEYGDSDSAYRSDSIMLVRVDPKNVKVTLVSIHRDTMVDLGEYGTQKINAAYSIGGPSYATEVISDFAGVDISHYAEVDMDSFTSIVDQVGGITVDLPIAVKDPDYTGLDLEAGEQTLDGHTAALLCRARHAYDAYGDGDRYRAANQRIVMSAVVQKVLASDPATMVSTITTMADSVTTDMTLSQIITLAEQMKDLDVPTDVMSGMEPTTSAYINATWYEIVNEDEWKAMMERVDQGLSPSENSNDDEMTQNVAAAMPGTESTESNDTSDASDTSEGSTPSSDTSSSESERLDDAA